ncbi:hypothetical protein EV702DRAFT_1076987 [Suillus placidus]|uniref:Uncharacterized protein n=1 Tax=Suillus placidus TaxID=48579 RepID=A0A9P7A236_9AGAM|nr:hypothetical protein EV702DRAFT_1076987 [Suillus placidus]
MDWSRSLWFCILWYRARRPCPASVLRSNVRISSDIKVVRGQRTAASFSSESRCSSVMSSEVHADTTSSCLG